MPKPLELGVADSVLRASAALCDLKIELDKHARHFIGQPLLNDWMGAQGTCAYWGDEFLRLVIPFLRWERARGKAFQAYVDPRFVLGASINGRPESIAATDVPGRIKKYASTFGSIDHVHYIWYRALGILAAHEGKHRVAFMRAHDQPAIAAWVSEATYPDASRITIVEPDHREEWLAILDGRYIQVLRRPEVSKMMLGAYGVKIARWSGIIDLPDKNLVIDTVRQRGLHTLPATSAEEERTLDLEELVRQQHSDAELIVRSVHDLEPYRFEGKRYAMAVAACIALGAILKLFNTPTTNELAFILLGAGCGLVAGVSQLRFVGPRLVAGLRRTRVD